MSAPVPIRGLAALPLAIVLAGDLATVLHLASVRHAPCPEHGGHVHGHGPEGATVVLRAGPTPRIGHEAGEGPRDAHTDCRALSLTGRAGVLSVVAVCRGAVAEAVGLLPSSRPAPPAAVPLHRLAPKHSPPV